MTSNLSFRDPLSGQPLRFKQCRGRVDFGYWQDDEGGTRWPVALGIPYLRASRSACAENVSHLISSLEETEALAQLLQDTDNFASQKPQLSDCRIVAEKLLNGEASLSGREMMEGLQFGPVADYFALRGLAPTFFSGSGLMKAGHAGARPVIEVACGAGHFLYWMKQNKIDAIGVDTVFSKLCLAHFFLGISNTELICAEVDSGVGLPFSLNESTTIFCHDAFYFFEDKAEVLADFRRLAGKKGAVIIGHAHLASADHGKVSGFPLQLSEYRSLTGRNTHFFDDRSLVKVGALGGSLTLEIPEGAEAVSFIEGSIIDNLPTGVWPESECLHLPLPLYWDADKQTTRMEWPSPAFAAEYADAQYLETDEDPSPKLPALNEVQQICLHPGLSLPAPFIQLGCRSLRWAIIGGGGLPQIILRPPSNGCHTPFW